jgi:hypothetical protein
MLNFQNEKAGMVQYFGIHVMGLMQRVMLMISASAVMPGSYRRNHDRGTKSKSTPLHMAEGSLREKRLDLMSINDNIN